jgi:tight adherence protein B
MFIPMFIFILCTLAFAFIMNNLLGNRALKRRINQLSDRKTLSVQSEKSIEDRKTINFMEMIRRFAKNIRTTEKTRNKIEGILESAGIPLKVEEFITIRVILFGVSTVFSLFIGIPFIISILIGFLGWQLPFIILKRKKEKRIALAGSQLPQALEIMSSAMKSGFSFMQAMQQVAKEVSDPIGVEFYRTIKDINFGMPMDIAFENLQKRVPNKDLEIVTTAILIQRSTGGNLSQILETIHETITERVKMKDELKALTAQGKMSALIITLLPVGLGLLLSLMNPEYFTPMLQHPVGWILIIGGIISGVLGWIFINKVVSIEV